MKAIKVGLAFNFQLLKSIPNEKNDQRLDIIITEKRAFKSCL